MDRDTISNLLAEVASGKLSPDEALEKLRWQPVEPIGDFARLDHHRALRQSMPEFVYGEGKSPEQVAKIMRAMVERTGRALATRVTPAHFEAVRAVLPDVVHHAKARIIAVNSFPKSEVGQALVIAAGTSDVPVAEEAAEVLRFLGDSTQTLYDVGRRRNSSSAGARKLFAGSRRGHCCCRHGGRAAQRRRRANR